MSSLKLDGDGLIRNDDGVIVSVDMEHVRRAKRNAAVGEILECLELAREMVKAANLAADAMTFSEQLKVPTIQRYQFSQLVSDMPRLAPDYVRMLRTERLLKVLIVGLIEAHAKDPELRISREDIPKEGSDLHQEIRMAVELVHMEPSHRVRKIASRIAGHRRIALDETIRKETRAVLAELARGLDAAEIKQLIDDGELRQLAERIADVVVPKLLAVKGGKRS